MNNKLFFIFHYLSNNYDLEPIDTKEISKVRWIDVSNINLFISFHDSNRSLRELNKKINTLADKINKTNLI